MRRRTCAAVVLCGPLLAGCGAATRLDFRGHSRPASPLQVSVYLGGPASDHSLLFDPSAVRPLRAGPVLFDIANQTRDEERFSLRQHGRVIAATPMIAPGQAAQLKADLRGRSITFETFGIGSRPQAGTSRTSTELRVSRPARNGDNALAQP